MDPYYFLDLYIEYPEGKEEDCDLAEFTDMYPDGKWVVGCNDEDFDEYKIIYEGEEYTYVCYDNNEKMVYFCRNGKLIKQIKIAFVEVPIDKN